MRFKKNEFEKENFSAICIVIFEFLYDQIPLYELQTFIMNVFVVFFEDLRFETWK